MFFASNSLLDTLLMTIVDINYGKKGQALYVILHEASFKEIGIRESGTYGQHKIPVSLPDAPTSVMRWIIDDAPIKFILSPDMLLNEVFIAQDSTLNKITHTNATDKNTLP